MDFDTHSAILDWLVELPETPLVDDSRFQTSVMDPNQQVKRPASGFSASPSAKRLQANLPSHQQSDTTPRDLALSSSRGQTKDTSPQEVSCYSPAPSLDTASTNRNTSSKGAQGLPGSAFLPLELLSTGTPPVVFATLHDELPLRVKELAEKLDAAMELTSAESEALKAIARDADKCHRRVVCEATWSYKVVRPLLTLAAEAQGLEVFEPRDSTLRTECLTKTSLKQVIRKIDFAIGWEYDRWQKELYDPIRECGLWNLPLSPYRDHEFNRQFFGACFEIKADKGSETGSKGRTQIAVWSAAYLRWMYSLCNTLGKNPEDLPPIFAGLVDEGVWTSFIADVTLADDTSTSALGASKISQVTLYPIQLGAIHSLKLLKIIFTTLKQLMAHLKGTHFKAWETLFDIPNARYEDVV